MRSIRLTPITAEIVIISVAIYLGCAFQSASSRQPFSEIQRGWNAILDRHVSEVHDGVRRPKEPELHGPFDVWNREWWRIFVTVFHHPDLLNLVFSVGAVWYLGSLLERHWGSLAMAAFLGPATCIPVLIELWLGQAYMGMSGLACAILGALVVLRHFDSDVAVAFSQDAAELGMVLIVVGWLATLADVVSLPNAAHIAGFAYGAGITGLMYGPGRKLISVRVCLILMHVWLIPWTVYLVCRPFWIGRYNWYQALATRNPVETDRNLKRAVQFDGGLTGAWLQWSHLSEEKGNQDEAWEKLINGLDANPASAPLIDSARKLWRHLDLRQRRDAQLLLENVFGKKAAAEWLEQIRTAVQAAEEIHNENVTVEEPTDEVHQFSLDRKVDLPPIDSLPERNKQQNRKIPVDQNEAVEGKTL